MKPSDNQKKAKVKLWNRCKDSPLLDPAHMTDRELVDIVGDTSLYEWLKDEEFRGWFLDSKVLDDMISLGAEAAVARLIKIVNEQVVGPRESVSSSSQVAAAKLLLEYAGMMPVKKTETVVKADQLPNDEKALRDYIEKNARKLKVLHD